MVNIPSKKCNKCGQKKAINNFSKHRDCTFGVRNICKACQSLEGKEYNKTHREQKKQWMAQNKESVNKSRDKWIVNNPNYQRSEEYKRNQREKAKKWRENNSERFKNFFRARRQNEPDKINVYAENRRAKKLLSGGKITVKEWRDLKEKYGNKCLSCGNPKVTMDHIVPLALFGENTINNIQPLCGKCNLAKGIKVIDYRPDVWFANEII